MNPSNIEARDIRLRLGLTLEQMGRILRCSGACVNAMEDGYFSMFESTKENYRIIKRLGEIALARRAKLDWSL